VDGVRVGFNLIGLRVTYSQVCETRLHRRGCRAGSHWRCHLLTSRTPSTFVGRTTHPEEIPTIIGNRHVNNNQLFRGYRREHYSSVIGRIHFCGPLDNIRLGLFNACSISNKSASIQQWITDKKINMAALVETCHDEASSPELTACTPPEFKFVEKARPRKTALSMSTSHGGVCMIYDASLRARPGQLPIFSTFEVVAAYIHRASFNSVVIVLYRPDSHSVTSSFFDDFNDLLERLATYSSPLMKVDDFNIHMDDVKDVNACKLLVILVSHSLLQHVSSSTNRRGHILDLIITRDNQHIHMLQVDPPLLSDHALIVADCASVVRRSTRIS
jgi:hypothetical protein